MELSLKPGLGETNGHGDHDEPAANAVESEIDAKYNRGRSAASDAGFTPHHQTRTIQFEDSVKGNETPRILHVHARDFDITSQKSTAANAVYGGKQFPASPSIKVGVVDALCISLDEGLGKRRGLALLPKKSNIFDA